MSSLRDRLTAQNPIIQAHTEAEGAEIQRASATSDFLNLKEQLHILLVEKVNSTPIWVNYDDEQQKELIRQFVEGQLLGAFKTIPLNKNENGPLKSDPIWHT